MIVPFPPGGATDVLGRILGQSLQTVWNQTIIQENKPGAAGLIGARQVSLQEMKRRTEEWMKSHDRR